MASYKGNQIQSPQSLSIQKRKGESGTSLVLGVQKAIWGGKKITKKLKKQKYLLEFLVMKILLRYLLKQT